jgi:hypothetical protein
MTTDETVQPASPAPPSSNGLTFMKGVGLVIGGAALGFFGCLGALSTNSMSLVVAALVAGGAIIVWGAVLMLIGFVKGLIGLTKPKEEPKE